MCDHKFSTVKCTHNECVMTFAISIIDLKLIEVQSGHGNDSGLNVLAHASVFVTVDCSIR